MPDKKILIIDDEFEIRGFMQDFFEERGYVVDTAGDGLEGVEKFKKGKYDLVLCDMMMPKMIGTEALRQIKEKKPSQRVIMITGIKEQSMVTRAKELGCLHYLNKPFSLTDLSERVAECFSSKDKKD